MRSMVLPHAGHSAPRRAAIVADRQMPQYNSPDEGEIQQARVFWLEGFRVR
jgi:hypothetical protein